jgi:hypothetical protein
VAAQEFCTALTQQRFVGSPDAQKLTVRIQLEKKFVKGFNQSDERM